jgi:hypothetical protein
VAKLRWLPTHKVPLPRSAACKAESSRARQGSVAVDVELSVCCHEAELDLRGLGSPAASPALLPCPNQQPVHADSRFSLLSAEDQPLTPRVGKSGEGHESDRQSREIRGQISEVRRPPHIFRGVGSERAGWPGAAARRGAAVIVLTAGLLMATSVAGDSNPRPIGSHAGPDARGVVHFATHNFAEIRKTVPIARNKWDKKRVVMSLGPRRLPTFHRGDVLRTSAEVLISNTCIVFYAARCIGRHYRISPREDARIVLADRRLRSGDRHVRTIAGTDSLRCHQPRPDRNHHCVLVFPPARMKLRHPHHLPCRPDACHLNLVLEADHPRARHGEVILVGADRPDGTVRQDKGRLNAIVLHGQVPPPASFHTGRRVSSVVPVAPAGRRGRRVVYSQRINRVRRGDVLEVSARHLVTISSLPYSSFIGTHVILARGRHGVAASPAYEITETNGFNCTHGPSAYRDPCRTRKFGALRVHHTVIRDGRRAPAYVNVVVAGKAKRASPQPGDRLHVLAGGSLAVRRYRAP